MLFSKFRKKTHLRSLCSIINLWTDDIFLVVKISIRVDSAYCSRYISPTIQSATSGDNESNAAERVSPVNRTYKKKFVACLGPDALIVWWRDVGGNVVSAWAQFTDEIFRFIVTWSSWLDGQRNRWGSFNCCQSYGHFPTWWILASITYSHCIRVYDVCSCQWNICLAWGGADRDCEIGTVALTVAIQTGCRTSQDVFGLPPKSLHTHGALH